MILIFSFVINIKIYLLNSILAGGGQMMTPKIYDGMGQFWTDPKSKRQLILGFSIVYYKV